MALIGFVLAITIGVWVFNAVGGGWLGYLLMALAFLLVEFFRNPGPAVYAAVTAWHSNMPAGRKFKELVGQYPDADWATFRELFARKHPALDWATYCEQLDQKYPGMDWAEAVKTINQALSDDLAK